MTITNRLIGLYCTLIRSPPPNLPLNPLPSPLQVISRGFIALFHIWCQSTIFPHLNLLHSLSSFPKYSPNHIYFIVLSSVINFKVNVQRDFSVCPCCKYALLWSIQPVPLLFLTASLSFPTIQQFSIYISLISFKSPCPTDLTGGDWSCKKDKR
jgi:hypothetical protein